MCLPFALRWGRKLMFDTDFDTVTLSSGLVIQNQSIGVASTHNGFAGYDGILGYAELENVLGRTF